MNFTSKRFHSILIGLILAITGVAYADENGDWKKIKEDKGITVHQRKIAGWDIKQTRAHGQIATSAEEILAIIDDAKIAKEIQELIKQRIKPKTVELKGEFQIKTYAPNGVKIIKDAFKKIKHIRNAVKNEDYVLEISSDEEKMMMNPRALRR